MEILYNLKCFPLPSFLHPVLGALSLPQSSHAANYNTDSVFNVKPTTNLRISQATSLHIYITDHVNWDKASLNDFNAPCINTLMLVIKINKQE